MMAKTKNQKGFEYYKKKFLEYAKRIEADEEMRLATEYQVKVNVRNIVHYSAFLQGARRALLFWQEYEKASENKVFKDAIMKLITLNVRYLDMFLMQRHEIRFRNHQYDKKGKLISAEAYFVEKVTIYREV